MSKQKKTNQKRLVKMFKDIKRLKCDDNRFCFLIGAGASKSSGISTGREMSEKWYNELKDDLDQDELIEWENEIDFDIDRIDEFTLEDLIADEEMVITITHTGYIKSLSVSAYRRQNRHPLGHSRTIIRYACRG